MLIILGMLVLLTVVLLARGRRTQGGDRGWMSDRWIAEYRSSHLANLNGPN
jgi:hypothetical protein